MIADISQPETGSKPAPGKVALIQAFVNTLDLEGHRDALASPELLTHWLKRHALLNGDYVATQADLQRALGVPRGAARTPAGQMAVCGSRLKTRAYRARQQRGGKNHER